MVPALSFHNQGKLHVALWKRLADLRTLLGIVFVVDYKLYKSLPQPKPRRSLERVIIEWLESFITRYFGRRRIVLSLWDLEADPWKKCVRRRLTQLSIRRDCESSDGGVADRQYAISFLWDWVDVNLGMLVMTSSTDVRDIVSSDNDRVVGGDGDWVVRGDRDSSVSGDRE